MKLYSTLIFLSTWPLIKQEYQIGLFSVAMFLSLSTHLNCIQLLWHGLYLHKISQWFAGFRMDLYTGLHSKETLKWWFIFDPNPQFHNLIFNKNGRLHFFFNCFSLFLDSYSCFLAWAYSQVWKFKFKYI